MRGRESNANTYATASSDEDSQEIHPELALNEFI